MPYLHFKTTLHLSPAQKSSLSQKIANCVKLLSGKPAERAMIHIEDGCEIYRGGTLAQCAFMETIYQTPLPLEEQKAYIEALYALFLQELELVATQVYFAMIDLDTWGSRGTLH